MLCKDIIENLERLSPPEYAEGWDNVGVLTGSLEKEVKSVYIGLDATDILIENAIQKKADLIITHHPMIFSPLKKIVDSDYVGKRLINLIKNDITYYAMHTNFDLTVMAEIAASQLGLKKTRILDFNQNEYKQALGFGRMGELPHVMSLQDCADYVKRCFGLQNVKVYGDLQKQITVAAIVPGSGKSMIKSAIKEKADVLITGDIDHHDGIDAVMQNLAVIDAGHYGIEHIFISFMADYLQKEWKDLTVYKEPLQNPFFII